MNLPDKNQPASKIDRVVVDAVLSGRIKAGTRLQEQQLAQLFGVSRTIVREALIRLETRGIVLASARRGWFVIEPSIDEAREAFQARRAIEIGLLHSVRSVSAGAIHELKLHIAREKEAIRLGDVAARAYLLGDFHVCMAEVLCSRLLADILRDLTVRTALISMMYQSTHKASESCDEHIDIVKALEVGDMPGAARLMIDHISHVELGLRAPVKVDPLTELRDALRPLNLGGAAAPKKIKPSPIKKGANR
ncbi:MAG: GntR family transcriptional regulator [Hyphomicrobiales bacterium]|nr:GntR family transcriptional regulator [Alphaproteobacteria bacterium]